MIKIQWDVHSPWTVEWPRSDEEVLMTTRKYLAYETSLPLEQQLGSPSAAEVQTLFDQIEAVHQEAQRAETDRAIAANLYQNALKTALPLLDQAILGLKARHYPVLAALESWGLETTVQGKRISVRKPNGASAWLAFFRRYVAREISLAPEERLPQPSLAHLQTLLHTIETNLQARNQAQARREAAIDERGRLSARLRRLIQAAILLRVALDADGQVTNVLEQWGVAVVERKSPDPVPETPPTL